VVASVLRLRINCREIDANKYTIEESKYLGGDIEHTHLVKVRMQRHIGSRRHEFIVSNRDSIMHCLSELASNLKGRKHSSSRKENSRNSENGTCCGEPLEIAAMTRARCAHVCWQRAARRARDARAAG
jgi:hypothetical protein